MSEDPEDIIKKMAEDVSETNSDQSSDEDDFNALLDSFIENELQSIEDEKDETRKILEEPDPQKFSSNARDQDIANSLENAEQKLYTAYCNYVEAIQGISAVNHIREPKFHIKAKVLYPHYTQSLGNLISIDVLQGWDIMFKAFPKEIIDINPHASDEDLLDFAEKQTDENLQMAVVSYVEILFEIENCEIDYEKRFMEYERRKIEEEIAKEQEIENQRIQRYIKAVEKKHFPIDAARLINNYFKTAAKDPDGAYQALINNPAMFAPIEIDKIRPKFFGLIRPSPHDGLIYNRKIGEFLKKLKA